MDWRSILVVTLAILVALFSHKLWLPSLLNSLQGKRIRAKWADKEYFLSVEEAEGIIENQQAAIQDDDWGIFANILKLPNVVGVDFGPKEVHGMTTQTFAIKVKVSKKVPVFELNQEEVIPSWVGIGDEHGLPTDVIEV